MTRKLPIVVAAAAALLLPATAEAKTPSCTRGGGKLEQADGGVRIVRVKARRESRNETRHENLLACWTRTGKRTTVSEEVDFGDDNRASTRVEIVDGRYVGVVETNEGGVSISASARVYDARTRKLLHDSAACDELDRGDYSGPDDVAFLDGGGLAFTCGQLIAYKGATGKAQQLEPAGTDVRQVAVSRHSDGFGQRLFWTVGDGVGEVAKSVLF
jgi:hypothetical protein